MLIINTKLIEYIYGYGWTGNRKETRGRTSRLRMKSFISIWKVWEMAPVIFQLALASVFALRIVLETWRHAQVKTRWTITLWVALQVILYLKCFDSSKPSRYGWTKPPIWFLLARNQWGRFTIFVHTKKQNLIFYWFCFPQIFFFSTKS